MVEQVFGGSGGSRSTMRGSRFPPIADYGFISDCEVCALVAPPQDWPAALEKSPDDIKIVVDMTHVG